MEAHHINSKITLISVLRCHRVTRPTDTAVCTIQKGFNFEQRVLIPQHFG